MKKSFFLLCLIVLLFFDPSFGFAEVVSSTRWCDLNPWESQCRNFGNSNSGRYSTDIDRVPHDALASIPNSGPVYSKDMKPIINSYYDVWTDRYVVDYSRAPMAAHSFRLVYYGDDGREYVKNFDSYPTGTLNLNCNGRYRIDFISKATNSVISSTDDFVSSGVQNATCNAYEANETFEQGDSNYWDLANMPDMIIPESSRTIPAVLDNDGRLYVDWDNYDRDYIDIYHNGNYHKRIDRPDVDPTDPIFSEIHDGYQLDLRVDKQIIAGTCHYDISWRDIGNWYGLYAHYFPSENTVIGLEYGMTNTRISIQDGEMASLWVTAYQDRNGDYGSGEIDNGWIEMACNISSETENESYYDLPFEGSIDLVSPDGSRDHINIDHFNNFQGYSNGGGDGTGGNGSGSGCDACESIRKQLECPYWNDYMGEWADMVRSTIPPPPDWNEVADTFRDSIVPALIDDLADLYGDVPEPPTVEEILNEFPDSDPDINHDIDSVEPFDFNELDFDISNFEEIEIEDESQPFQLFEPLHNLDYDDPNVPVIPGDSRNNTGGIKMPDQVDSNIPVPSAGVGPDPVGEVPLPNYQGGDIPSTGGDNTGDSKKYYKDQPSTENPLNGVR